MEQGPYKRSPTDIIGGNSPGGEARCKHAVIATSVGSSPTPPTTSLRSEAVITRAF